MLKVKKRGRIYRLDGKLGEQRVRLTLQTTDCDAAESLRRQIDRAMHAGSSSRDWAELCASKLVPRTTLAAIASVMGYPLAPAGRTTWTELERAFIAEATRRIAQGKMRSSTLKRYRQAVAAFGIFLEERGACTLAEISRATIADFKAWRIERILEKKQARKGSSLDLDLAILHSVFAYALDAEMLAKNPVKIESTPGRDPQHGAEPFTAEQLRLLRESAGDDLLAFLLLRHTGLRGGDAVGLRWEEISLADRHICRVTEKRRKRVWIPLHEEIAFAMDAEHARRKPRPDECVLLNPETGGRLTRPRLYERMLALGRRARVSNANPHRFRDTFAIDLLLKGASPYDVAKLLGDTIDTIERHYTPFVRELQERTRRIIANPEGLENPIPRHDSGTLQKTPRRIQ